jgi:hypothetical protein
MPKTCTDDVSYTHFSHENAPFKFRDNLVYRENPAHVDFICNVPVFKLYKVQLTP